MEYLVIDSNNRIWGSVRLNSGEKGCFGYLNPSDQFDEVHPLFKLHEKLLAQEGDMKAPEIEESSRAISNLNVALKSTKTNTISNVGIVFISETSKGLLFSCEHEPNT